MQTSELFQPDGNEFYSAVNGTVETALTSSNLYAS